MSDCTHDLAERETACFDGMCPLCLAAENARLQAAIKWTQEVRPGKNKSGGATVRMTWQQFDTMRELSKGEKG